MSLRPLPQLTAPSALKGVRFEPPSDAMARWTPEVRAAADEDAASIDIYDVVDDFFGFSARRMAAALRSVGARDVVVNINSAGGSVFEGISIYEQLRAHDHRVTVNVMGLAASIASVIAMAGDEVRIAKTSFLMIHNAWSIVVGNRHDLRQAADWLEPFDSAIASVYADRGDIDEARAAEMMDAETWIAGAQAVELGLADAYMPADQVVEDETAGAETAAARTLEHALMVAHPEMSRRERRSLIASRPVGTPSAADDLTPSAEDPAAARLLAAMAVG